MDLLGAAVANNVAWCSTVCGPGRHEPDVGVWLCDGTPAPLFPDAVTVGPGVRAEALVDALPTSGPYAVKDSFADVDLAAFGFVELFAASWIGHPPGRPGGEAEWSLATEVCPEGSFPASLLGDPAVRVLTGWPGAGMVLNRSDGVVGVSNVVHPDGDGPRTWHQVVDVAAGRFPGLPVVGYESGADLADALDAGFSVLGPLRVWVRPSASS